MIYDKRKLKRYDIFLIVEFKPQRSSGGFSIGITRDLSPDGFSIESQNIECQCGDLMEFRLKHPDASWTVDISGEVIWRNHSWYKYIIGIKFLDVSEEQKAKIVKLMSVIRDDAFAPDLINQKTESMHSEGKEHHPDAILSAGAINSHPSGKRVNAGHVSLKSAEHCELTGTERTFITGDVFGISISEAAENIKTVGDKGPNPESAPIPVDDKTTDGTVPAAIKKENAEHKKSYPSDLNTNAAHDAAQTPSLTNNSTSGNNRKRKLWLYVPFVMVISIIFVIALPVMIKKFNNSSKDVMTVQTESTDNKYFEKDADISTPDISQMSSEALSDSPEPFPVQQNGTQDAILPEKDKATNLWDESAGEDLANLPLEPIVITGGNSKKAADAAPPAKIEKTVKNRPPTDNTHMLSSSANPGPNKVENSEKKIDLIAKIDETFTALRTIQNEEPGETKVAIETKKTPVNKPSIKSEEPPAASQVVKPEVTPAAAAVTDGKMAAGATPLVIPPVPPQAVKIEAAPAAAAVTDSAKIDMAKLVISAPEKNIDKKIKAIESVNKPEMPDVALLVKRDKYPQNPNNSLSVPGITITQLLKKWKHIGDTRSGVPLFIAPDNTTHPREHVVNLLVKAYVNKKNFVDLLAINCSQVKLRILEKHNGDNPVLSSYSSEWKDIKPDSMILYNSACPEKK